MSQIEIYPFKKSDIFELTDMYYSQNVRIPSTFPELGFIVRNHENKPIAAGFLRMVEGGLAQMDSFVTNSKATGEERHQAIELLTQTLITTAKNMKLNGLLVITQIESIANRAVKQGFVLNSSVVLGLKLD